MSIDDGCIVTASLDGMVYVWDIGKRQCSTMVDRRYAIHVHVLLLNMYNSAYMFNV